MSESQGGIEIVDRESCDLFLRVDNGSTIDNPLGLTLTIDGHEVAVWSLEYRHEHYSEKLPLRLEPGRHRLVASTDTGVSLERTFAVQAGGPKLHGMLSYYYCADEDGRVLDLGISSTPIGIR